MCIAPVDLQGGERVKERERERDSESFGRTDQKPGNREKREQTGGQAETARQRKPGGRAGRERRGGALRRTPRAAPPPPSPEKPPPSRALKVTASKARTSWAWGLDSSLA